MMTAALSIPYFRLFEGGILPQKAFWENTETTAIYWGTSGQRRTTGYQLDPFAKIELLEKENLCPDRSAMERAVVIRKNPLAYVNDEDTKRWGATLGPCIREFTDVSEAELRAG